MREREGNKPCFRNRSLTHNRYPTMFTEGIHSVGKNKLRDRQRLPEYVQKHWGQFKQPGY